MLSPLPPKNCPVKDMFEIKISKDRTRDGLADERTRFAGLVFMVKGFFHLTELASPGFAGYHLQAARL
jgi:hypothetical protein